jgi:hypothetical protein
MNFIPDTQPSPRPEGVPFFDDVKSSGGWAGHTTRKSITALQSEIADAIERLGGVIKLWQRGTFSIDGQERQGYRLEIAIEKDGGVLPGQLDVAALPVKMSHALRKSRETRREQSMKMALYMLREAFSGLWFLQQLAPGYAPLIPLLLVEGGKTVGEMWLEAGLTSNLLPAPGEAFIEGEHEDV